MWRRTDANGALRSGAFAPHSQQEMVPCGHGHEDRQTSWNGAPACRGRSQTRNNFAPYVDRRCGIPLRSRTGGDPRRQDDHRRRGLRRQTEIHQEIRASGRYRPRGDDGQGDIVESPEPKVVRQIGTPCSSEPIMRRPMRRPRREASSPRNRDKIPTRTAWNEEKQEQLDFKGPNQRSL